MKKWTLLVTVLVIVPCASGDEFVPILDCEANIRGSVSDPTHRFEVKLEAFGHRKRASFSALQVRRDVREFRGGNVIGITRQVVDGEISEVDVSQNPAIFGVTLRDATLRTTDGITLSLSSARLDIFSHLAMGALRFSVKDAGYAGSVIGYECHISERALEELLVVELIEDPVP